MKNFLTDSIKIKHTYPDFKFISRIFFWKLKEDQNSYIELISKKIIKEDLSGSLVGIVSPTNYRLLYDILSIDSNAEFYKPEDFKFGKRKKFNFNKLIIFKEFDKYIKRSYLSYLNYENLRRVGLKRIEQYVLMLGILSFRNIFVYDNILVKNNELTVEKIKEEKEVEIKIKEISLINFIYILQLKYKFSFEDILSYILRMYSELKITDPFSNSFIFLEEDDSDIYRVYKELISDSVKVTVKKIKTDHGFFEVKISDRKSLLNDYLMLQREDYFEGKIIHTENSYPNVLLLYNFLSFIMPFKDYVLTLKLLLFMKKVSILKSVLFIEDEIIKKIQPKKNIAWINKSIWKEIYENQDYLFGHIIEPILCKTIEFKCPICGEENYSVTPQKIFCGKNNCNFKFNRINLKSFGISKISVEQAIESLSSGSLLLRTNNNKNIPVFLNNDKNYYYLYI